MGRGKIEIKRIENSANRQVTYSKRRGGIIKKAKEITVLCDAEISLIIFSSTGKMSEYLSPSTNLMKLLDKYQTASGKKLWDARHEYLKNEVDRIKKENDSMQTQLRHLEGEDLSSLTTQELNSIEEVLTNGAANVRTAQNEFLKILQKKERDLDDENKRLRIILHHQQLAMDGSVRDLDPGYHQKARDYASQMPFAFRVQPIQPNLQQNK